LKKNPTKKRCIKFKEILKVQSEVKAALEEQKYSYEALVKKVTQTGSLFKKNTNHLNNQVGKKYFKCDEGNYFQNLLFSFNMDAFIYLVEDYPTLKAFSLVLPYI
jgi:predicted ATPase